MGTITMSGFNNIDWSQVLTAVMAQERQPLTALENKQSDLQAQQKNLATLATKLATLESAADDLSSPTTSGGRTGSSTNDSSVSISASSTARVGNYQVDVASLATAQVTTSSTVLTDRDQTVVATGGTLKIGSASITLSGPVTLQGLADAINASTDSPASATVVQANGNYKLVLTGSETGKANAFVIDPSGLNAGSTIAFSATNVVDSADASFTVNGVQMTSTSNTITDAIVGATITLHRKTTDTVALTVAQDSTAVQTKLQTFVTAYNDLVKFMDDQTQQALSGTAGNLGRDSMLRGLRRTLNTAMLDNYAGTGAFANLSEIGLEFQRTGKIGLKMATFSDKMSTNQADIEALLAGKGAGSGAFDAIKAAIKGYTDADGLVPNTQERVQDQVDSLTTKINDFEDRLAIRAAALLQEYTAADEAMASLKASSNSLNSLSNVYKLY